MSLQYGRTRKQLGGDGGGVSWSMRVDGVEAHTIRVNSQAESLTKGKEVSVNKPLRSPGPWINIRRKVKLWTARGTGGRKSWRNGPIPRGNRRNSDL